MRQIALIFFLVIIMSGVALAFTSNKKTRGGIMDKKVLVAYYSYSGNTKSVAKKIQSITDSDIFEIVPELPYSSDYNTVVEQVKKEKENNTFVKLKDNGNTKSYDVIFIGTPVWWYTMATPVKTFIKENDFNGKIIVPFCTHGGGGASSTYIDMQKLAPDAKILSGFASYENSAKQEDVQKWIDSLGL